MEYLQERHCAPEEKDSTSPPVNSRILAQAFEKGRPQERRMWDESDAHKNTQACTPRKETCVGSDQQSVSTKQTIHFWSESNKRELKNKHRVIHFG